ncbi:MAG: aminomethyl transferase family protein [Rhodospirillales bacterium]|nr:aminomethyl transferase family protein [Rhodospirillales bacterium]MSP81036.1 aminomethyl transferase family protein [Rhodospirillales bacterium]
MPLDIARLVRDFGDPEAEARAARNGAALFDFSFIARARISGPGAGAVLARFQSRPVADMAPGAIRYALRLGPDGAVEADLTIWRLDAETFEVMSGRSEDIAALDAEAGADALVADFGDATAIFAVQGPRALDVLAAIGARERLAAIPYFGHAAIPLAGVPCRVGRLGYTGERGFEIVADKADAARLDAAIRTRARPAGFAAADILRIEAGFILFVNECRLRPSADALGFERFAPNAPGNSPLRLVAFTAGGTPVRSPWQPGPDLAPPARPGEIAITSAAASVALGQTIGLGFVHAETAAAGTPVQDLSGGFADVRVARIPLYRPSQEHPRGPWLDHAPPPPGHISD